MKNKLAIAFALIGWFAVIAQLVLMLENRVALVPETIIRFFSFFTILTNTLVAVYFTCIVFIQDKNRAINKPGFLTAITIYIVLVGAVYQIALRHVWHPQGLQRVVDELLHTVIPILVIVFWSSYESTKNISYLQILKWAIYPLTYLIFILIRGIFSNFYPYPFIDVVNIGMTKALINSGVLVLVFVFISVAFVFIGKSIIKR